MKVEFEKKEIEVGLSSTLPLHYLTPEEKYFLADAISGLNTDVIPPDPTNEPSLGGEIEIVRAKFTKTIITFEVDTSAQLIRSPERNRCYQIISTMPEEALKEVEEELLYTRNHYLAIAKEQQKMLVEKQKMIAATVLDTKKF